MVLMTVLSAMAWLKRSEILRFPGAKMVELRAVGETAEVGRLAGSADQVSQVLGAAETESDPLTAVVLVSAGPATGHGELVALAPEQWRQRVEIPLQKTMACFQASHRRLGAHGGSLVLVLPTLALVGAAGLVPWATVAEGQRSLAKAAARAWGGQGIKVNTVAVPAGLLAPWAEGLDRPGQPPASLEGAPSLDGQVAAVVASLVSESWAGVTGATVAVDGGVWMTP
jgi:NAD(P)-dependent dehydrogenase (short-subunit alcohol dehydrogenase family)